MIYSAGKKEKPTIVRIIDTVGVRKEAPAIVSFYARPSPNGSVIAYIDEKEGTIYLADKDGGKPKKLVDSQLFLKKFNKP